MPSPLGDVGSESTAVVANAQPDTLLQHLEQNPGLLRAAVPDTITHRFLDIAEQVRGLFRRHGLRGSPPLKPHYNARGQDSQQELQIFAVLQRLCIHYDEQSNNCFAFRPERHSAVALGSEASRTLELKKLCPDILIEICEGLYQCGSAGPMGEFIFEVVNEGAPPAETARLRIFLNRPLSKHFTDHCKLAAMPSMMVRRRCDCSRRSCIVSSGYGFAPASIGLTRRVRA